MRRLALGILCVALTHCGGDEPVGDLSEAAEESAEAPAVAKKKKRKRRDKDKGPAFSYSPVGKRDPFRSYLADLSAQQTESFDRTRQKTEEFEISQYRLTGLITGTSQPRAMVEDPNKEGHALKVGSRLGRNSGRVTRISKTGIEVVEEYRNPTGELIRVKIPIPLPDPAQNAQ